MTEKRFTDVKGYVYDKKNCIGFIQDDYTCENIINLLNALHEENQALKSDRVRYEEECRLDIFKELHEENEQLKKEIAKTEKIKQQRDFYYARLQKIIKIANGDFE